MFLRFFYVWPVASCMVAFLFLPAAIAEETPAKVRSFLRQYCQKCHGPQRQENDLRFDTLKFDFNSQESVEVWQGILDQLNRGAMPPKDALQPKIDEKKRLSDLLGVQLKKAYESQRSTNRQTVLRRLNRFELRNTIRDLLYLQGSEWRIDNVSRLVDNNGNGSVSNTSSDPFRMFPDDEGEGGFRNNGNRLVTSDFFLKLMIGAAEESLQMATQSPREPSRETRRLGFPIAGAQGQNWGGTLESFQRKTGEKYDAIFRRYHRFARLRPDALRRGVGVSGQYRITVEVSAHHQKHSWGELLKTDQSQPFRLGLHMVNHRDERASFPLAEWQVPADRKIHQFSHEAWLDSGFLPWLGWENGPGHRDVTAEQIVKLFYPKRFRNRPKGKGAEGKRLYEQWQQEMVDIVLGDGYRGPHLRIHSLTLEPIKQQWPPLSHTTLFGKGDPADADVADLLLAFAQRAYRRPVKPAEIAPFVALVGRQSGQVKSDPSAGILNMHYRIYDGKWTSLPDFNALKPVGQGSLKNGLVDIRLARKSEFFGMTFEGKIEVVRKGRHLFQLASDDGSRLFIDGKQVINHDGLHGASTRRGEIELEQGRHDIRLEYFAYGQPNRLQLKWSSPGESEVVLSADSDTRLAKDEWSGRSREMIKALQAGYTAILCSPDFLYLREKTGKLDDFEIASRLSYFLWSSMPDAELFDLAAAGKLSDPAVRRRQTDRMLNDPKSAAFMRGFTAAWLRLDQLGKMPPERGGPFRFYHDRRMEPQLIQQTAFFFEDAVQFNRPIENFIDSKYTFMNEEIANWFYNRQDVYGSRMQRVAVNDPRRGGILTQPSVMTATSNGVDTSPVMRGVWVLENILGTPPSPPPPDVEPLPTDLRGAKTIRDQLKLHRKHEACRSCHQKIDPLGFAFENLDPVGRWRDRYPKMRDTIDSSTVMANGTRVENIVELKKILLEKETLVTRCLAEKLLTYASGRSLEPLDRGIVDQVVQQLQTQKGGVRDLIHSVVNSEIFLSK